MPAESRRFAKTALLSLLLTFAAGAAFTFANGAGLAVPPVFAIEHAHLGFVGFLVNIVIGIALWMLPLNRERFPQTQGRYPPGAADLCFWLLNGGLATRVVVEPVQWMLAPRSLLVAVTLDAAALAQVAAVTIFAGIAWLRVRGPSPPRA